MRIQKGEFEMLFRAHAVFRAAERDIPWEMVERTAQEGRFENFGKNMVKIKKAFSKGTIILVGQKIGENTIKIITIEWGR